MYKRYGDKSNRLLQNMHFEAYCKYNDIKVGVHIRRGDYRGWNNGKYYYDKDLQKN